MNLERIGVIGAGTMGNGIAQVCASAGKQVVLLDVSVDSLDRGLKAVGTGLDRLVKKGTMTVSEREDAFGRIRITTDYAELAHCGLVIESATENPQVKFEILRKVEAMVSQQALIATNTSSISITQIAAVLSHPGRCVGLHFFNPVPAMALVEVIPGLQTSEKTWADVKRFSEAIGKTPITVRNSPGFVVNRILIPMINEAILAVQEKLCTADEVDVAMQLGGGHPIGPLRLADLVGLDVVLAIMELLQSSFGDSKYRPAILLREMVHAGRLGRKSGQGFYAY